MVVKEMKPGVLHLLDTLEPGGAERMAVTLVNHLPQERFRIFLGTTRREGPLATLVRPEVGRLALNRRWTFDPPALRRLAAFLRQESISILHAHGSSLLVARLATALKPRPALVWHVHYGRLADGGPLDPVYRAAARRIDAVIAVSGPLAGWCRERLGIHPDRVVYLPNFVADAPPGPVPDLPGEPGRRVVCVANLRAEKDHLNLLRAFARVQGEVQEAHLLLAGAEVEPACAARVREQAAALDGRISFLGSRPDVPALLRGCDVGVLASSSEGFPLSLLEYGRAGLAAVATRVGQCSEVLDGGEAGLLVPPGDPGALAGALLALLRDPARRAAVGERLCRRVQERYSSETVMEHLEAVYHSVLGPQES